MLKQNEDLKKKRKVLSKCPSCGKETFVISIFGSICSSCFYEEKEDKPKDLDLLNDKRVLMPRIYSFEEVRSLLKEQKEKIIKEMDRLKPLWITNLVYFADKSIDNPFAVAETHLDIILNDIKEILNK